MRTLFFLLLFVTASMSKLRFVQAHPGSSTPVKPILGVLNGGVSDTINQVLIESDTAFFTSISRVWVDILGPGVERSWYMQFGMPYEIDSNAFIGETGEIKGNQSADICVQTYLGCPDWSAAKSFDPHERFGIHVSVFSARDWSVVGSDIGGDANDMSYLGNTAKFKDTIDVRLRVAYYGMDSKGDPVAGDTISLDCRIEYNRGQLIPGLSIKGKSKSRLQAIAGGWKVPGEGTWSLRSSDGRQVPLRQRRESSGTVLEPQAPFRGLGILTDSKGRSQPVFASP